MRISTITPVLNTEKYIGEAVDSILAQTRPADEIIVVDDGSTDGTPAILHSYGDRIRVIRQDNAGQPSALNAGVAAATGDAFAFLDADDLWMPDKLRLQEEALTGQPELDAVFGGVEQFPSPEIPPEVARTFDVPEGVRPGISKITLLVRRTALERVGGFDGAAVADFVEWYSRATALGFRAEVLPMLLGRRRHHRGNMGRTRRAAQGDDILRSLKQSLDLRRRLH
jgi:glycosyltransferase involved in cell wall biosynthesis